MWVDAIASLIAGTPTPGGSLRLFSIPGRLTACPSLVAPVQLRRHLVRRRLAGSAAPHQPGLAATNLVRLGEEQARCPGEVPFLVQGDRPRTE